MSETEDSGRRSSQPLQRSRPAAALMTCAAVIIVFAALQQVSGILGPAFLALILVITVSPIGHWLMRKGVPRPIATLVVIFVLLAIMGGFVWLLVVSIQQLVEIIPTYSSQMQAGVNSLQGKLAEMGVNQQQVQDIVSRFDISQLTSVITSLLSQLTSITTNLFFIMLIMLFMAVDASDYPQRILRVARVRPAIAASMGNFSSGVRRYFGVSAIFGLICAVLNVVALHILDVPLPLLWGALSFITNFIPNIGFVVGIIPPALLALLTNGPNSMVWVIVSYIVINFCIQTLIQPRYLGNTVNLSVTVTVLSLTVWTWLLGPMGALLAIPATLFLRALLIDAYPETRWLGAFIDANAGPSKKPHRLENWTVGGYHGADGAPTDNKLVVPGRHIDDLGQDEIAVLEQPGFKVPPKPTEHESPHLIAQAGTSVRKIQEAIAAVAHRGPLHRGQDHEDATEAARAEHYHDLAQQAKEGGPEANATSDSPLPPATHDTEGGDAGAPSGPSPIPPKPGS
ncbi:AI-2E family transporter [Micrococcales bacterium 31B]|nr:AI-2E family transporter [Micrococcales bacterium 31B]